MRIYSLSKVIALPLVASFILALYLSYELNYQYALVWGMIPLLLITALFVFHGNIDFWWRQRHPIALDKPIKDWLMKFDPYYQSLDSSKKAEYDNRLMLYMEGRAFSSVGKEMHSVPNDIQGIVASNAVKMMINKNDYLIGDMDRIYLYKHPFPSPRFKFLHTVETDIEDGVYIFSLEHLVPGMINPSQHYNIVMHGFTEAYQYVYTKDDFSFLDSITWLELEKISNISKEQVLKTIGYPDTYISTVAMNHYFTFPDKFKEILPDKSRQLESIFGSFIKK